MMCLCLFINYNKHVILVRDADNVGCHARVGAEDIWEISVNGLNNELNREICRMDKEIRSSYKWSTRNPY